MGQGIECGTDYLHSQLMQSDTAYKRQFLSMESQVQTLIQNQQNDKLQLSVYTIPVVVHVIHLGEPVGTGTNISAVQIQQAIDGLNNRFRHITGSGVDTEIEFCLATADTNGSPSTGINRVNGSTLPRYQAHGISLVYSNCDAPAEDSVKDLSRWPVSRYYNIWVVNKLCQGFGGFVGYANYPNGGPYDGTVIASWVMDSSHAILAHEVAHGFFLFHTFYGDGGNAYCPVDTACLVNGDNVCDTPPHKQGDCNTTNPCTAGGVWSNSLNNYMSYCFQDRFTQDQKNRMRATASISPRLSLLTSSGCGTVPIVNYEDTVIVVAEPESDILVPSAFSPGNDQINNDYKVYGKDIVSIDLHIFNRWGQEVFATTDKNKGWNGTFNGENLATDVFAYYIKIILINQKTVSKKGTITLMR
jgi:gliding motility-associated-like protein